MKQSLFPIVVLVYQRVMYRMYHVDSCNNEATNIIIHNDTYLLDHNSITYHTYHFVITNCHY